MAKINFKEAALNHVEKVIFGIIMLLVLLGLAGTKWSHYDGTPHEITERVAKGRTVLKANRWNSEENADIRAAFALTQEDAPANVIYQALANPIDVVQFEMSDKIYKDPAGADEPLREPDLLAPQDLIATSGRVFVEIPLDPEEDESELDEDGTLAMAEEEDPEEGILDEFLDRTNVATGAAGMMDDEGYGGMYADYAMELAYDEGYDGGEYGESYDEGLGYPGMGGIGGVAAGPTRNGQGYHFASVRAVVPIRDQIRKYAEAIHQPYQVASVLFDIIDFELERQTKQPGEDPWSGPWEEVDINVATDVLESALGFDPEVVNSMITNAVITMPLPSRVSGRWKTQATHPRIEEFVLSDEEMALEVELNKKMLEELVEQKKAIKSTTIERGGFSTLRFDTRQMQSDLFGGSMYGGMGMYGGMDIGMGMGGYGGEGYDDGGYGGGMGMAMAMGRGGGAAGGRRGAPSEDPLQKLIDKMVEGEDTPQEQQDVLKEWISERISVSGELFLFRYLDFSVEPGKTYRYRVRLELKNPNFGRRAGDAGGLQHVVEGETRKTDWSNVTDEVTVMDDVSYFVRSIREAHGNRIFPSARMDVFQWDSEHGTTMNQVFEVDLGQKIADKIDTTVINPAENLYEVQSYQFTDEDFVVDAIEDLAIDRKFHSGDRVDPAFQVNMMKGANSMFVLKSVALVHAKGEGLTAIDEAAQAKQYEAMKNYLGQQETAFDYLQQQAEAVAGLGAYGGEYGGEYDEGMMGMYGMMGEFGMGGMMGEGGRRTRDSLRKGTSRRGRGR